jgi:hypothetical protein
MDRFGLFPYTGPLHIMVLSGPHHRPSENGFAFRDFDLRVRELVVCCRSECGSTYSGKSGGELKMVDESLILC